LPKDVSVTYAPILMQRRKDVWGDDAEEFKPDRWINPKPYNTDPTAIPTPDTANAHLRDLTHLANPFAFVPFNAGPRICLGMSFALAECMYTVVRMLQTFEALEIDESKQVISPHASQPDDMSSRQPRDKCWPRASLTLYIEVCTILPLRLGFPIIQCTRGGYGFDLFWAIATLDFHDSFLATCPLGALIAFKYYFHCM
jgi:hypothetical protein